LYHGWFLHASRACASIRTNQFDRARFMTLFRLARPLLHLVDAETAHRLTLAALRLGVVPPGDIVASPALAVNVLGLSFPNPLGLAAGFDKNAEVIDPMLGQGFGFVEVGSLTPEPQAGNPRPRLFRLPEDLAIINRLGFNNAGHDPAVARLERRRGRPGIVGINIGANRTTTDRIGDYLRGIARFNRLADYITLNVSSPNTPGLRRLQDRRELELLLARLKAERELATEKDGRMAPLLLKIAPDLDEESLADIAEVTMASAALDGLIISNTTLSRPALKSRHAGEAGGLSGRPLFERSTRILARMHRLTQGRLPLIGVGGIASADDAWRKITAGASLLQLYSALVYQGPELVHAINRGLAERLDRHRLPHLAAAVGTGVGDWL
jgi:dihydroorotate dehydrogenase